jgi:molybdate transport system substrate-binding protein
MPSRWRAVIALCALLSVDPVQSAELKVFATGAMRQTLAELAPAFTRDAGVAVVFTIGTAGETQARVERGEPVDLVIVPLPRLETMAKAGLVVPASRADIARAALALAVRAGATAPDIATPEAFRNALLAARAVAYTDPAAGGTAGFHFAGVLRRMGIASEVKSVLTRGGRDAAERVARGEAEFAVTFVSEILPVKGVRVAGLLPETFQLYTTYSAGLPPKGANPDTARAFVRHLTAPAAGARWRAPGLEPLGARR